MRKERSVKQRLVAAVLVLVMTMSAFVGATYAWFTDSVTSAGNTIQAGSLKIDLFHKVEGDWISIKENPKHLIFNYEKWEPGFTAVETLRIENLGNLALQYKLSIEADKSTAVNGKNGEKLSDVIDVYVTRGESTVSDYKSILANDAWEHKGTLTEVLANPASFIGGKLLPTGEVLDANADASIAVKEQLVTVALHMKEEAGNAYQSLSVGNVYVNLVATQFSYEGDGFGGDYDADAIFPELNVGGVSVPVKTQNNIVTEAATVDGEGVKGTVPAGVAVGDGVKKLTLSVTEKTVSDANLTLNDGEVLRPLDVHMDGVADNNTVPMLITVEKAMKVGLNIGNYTVYHVENGVSNAMTAVNTPSELDAHNEFYYDPTTGDVTLAMATFSEVAMVAEPAKWEGGRDYEWYDANATELTIANADQLAAFGAIVGGMDGQTQDSFKDKTVKLLADINLGDKESENNPDIIFYPIGYYNSEGTYERTNTAITSGLRNFEGTFDGNGNTVSNFYHNTWEMKGDHDWYSPAEQYYRDGMGLFGRVYKGTVKNLTVENFSSDGEIATTGVIAAYADGATFENIAIFNCNPRVYNIGNGGIVGCVGWYAKEADLKTTFKNITVDNTNKISALWGSYDVACGGIVGQYYPTSGQTSAGTPKNAGLDFENCHVSAQMDVYNDVCANYQYYAYRYTGMLIGSVRENVTIDGHVYPKMDGITAEGCTVHFGTWNDYYYCEIIDNTTASYTHDYQMSRLVEIKAIDGTTVTYLDGKTGTVPASGRANYVIVDYAKGHGTENATCYHFKNGAVWTHDMGGIQTGVDENGDGQDDLKEDKQHIYLEFNNLVTGYGWGVTTKGVGDLAGVTILDRDVANSVVKFEGKVTELANNKEYKLGDIFNFVNNGVELVPGALAVGVTSLDDNSPVSATIVYDRENWENGTITFEGTGDITITIQDYYFCTPTTIEVTVTARQSEEKFDVVMKNGDFLHRVGNQNAVSLSSLFKAKDGVTVGTVSVTVEAVNGTGASGTYTSNATWLNGTIQFNGTGVVKVTITDNEYCIPTVLNLEVVDAVNATTATSATSNNVVLLNDCGLSSLTVSGRYTFYGNGFTATYTGNGQYLNNGLKQGVVTVSENGTIDNLRIVASVYPSAYLFYSEAQKGPKDVEGDKTRYHYQLSAVAATGNAVIQNCYIYGGRTNIYIGDGNVTVKDSVLECGTLANSQIISSNEYTVTFENVTTIQHQVNATVGDTKAVMLGAGILVGDGDKDNKDATAPAISLKGAFKQYNWVTDADKEAVSDANAKMIIDGALNATDYNHTINGKKSSNLGIIYLNDFIGDFVNDTGLPYVKGNVTLKISGVNLARNVYSLQKALENQIYSDYENANRSTVNGLYQPQFKFDDDLGGQYIAKTDDGDEFLYCEGETIKVMFPSGDTKEINLAGLVNISKYAGQDLKLAITVKNSNGNSIDVTNGKITLSAADTYTVTYTVTDTLFYDKDGNTVSGTETYSWDVTIDVSLKDTAISNAYFVFDSSSQKIFRSGDSNIVQFIPFLSGLKIYDYDEDGNGYLRFDGGNTESTTDYDKISSATINNVNTTGEGQGYHIVTIEFEDGGKLVIDMDVRANSGSSKHSGSIKVRNNVIYVVNDGTTSGKGQTWKIYSYKFVGNNGTEIDSGEVTFGTAGTDCDKATKPTSNFSSGGSDSGDSGGSCVTPDTLITLADGTQVRVDSLKGDEELLVWDFYKGEYATVPTALIVNHGYGDQTVIKLTFDDGTVVKAITAHAFFDADTNKWELLNADNANEYIGHAFVRASGDGYTSTKLVKVDVYTEYTESYSLVSAYHYNFITENMFSLTNSVYAMLAGIVIGDNMIYDEETMVSDLEEYGRYTYADFAEYITYEQYVAFNGDYLKISVGKGYITYEEILELIKEFIAP